ncbi:glycosyl hydrolase family 61-domain-containing protein [Sphaerosporella brunnea]|uniref:Glycosyl hydrolase family 61-domain-containing protein n=1 Tax=Sphaerosporella brunnea TaxID=1250544 RepID=A0A5J5EB46_9PEZI|nr:glycosyl hydrolase family 61-domain-containing protein [Sphaerosporella brunnea]
MKSTIVSTLSFASAALAHGIVSQISIDGDCYDLYNPYSTPYQNPVPELIGWSIESNGPVEDVSTAGIACNTGSTAAQLSATAAAGADVKFFWTTWPESHKGPVMTYLANCNGNCKDADPTTLDFFKIDEAGLHSDGSWASDAVIADNSTWTVKIPSDIAAGNYLLRHELLALHAAGSANGAQFYPVCANLKITGSGSAVPSDTVKFPGGYKATDPGILINIYYPAPTNYTIPGPAVYTAGGAAGSGAVTTATTATTTSSVVTAPTSAADTATTVTYVPIGTAPAVSSAAAESTSSTFVPVVSSTSSIGTDGVMTSTIAMYVSSYVTETSTLVQTVKFTLTVTPTSTTVAKATKATTRKHTKYVTVTKTEKAAAATNVPECTPAGRYRNLW